MRCVLAIRILILQGVGVAALTKAQRAGTKKGAGPKAGSNLLASRRSGVSLLTSRSPVRR